MPPMRPHTKSRTGCTNCKRRKVKCDEGRPECFNCKRHGVTCSLSSNLDIGSPKRSKLIPTQPNILPISPLPSEIFESSVSTPRHHPLDPPDATASHIAPLPLDDISSRSFELVHHYSTITADTLSIRQDIRYVWGVAIPREGYKSTYVRHGILAMAAAHKAYLATSGRETYLALADYHQTMGSEGFRHALGNITRDTWSPIFSFSSLAILYLLTLPIRCDDMHIDEPVSRFLELMGLVRGMRTALHTIVPGVLRTEFAPLVYGVFPGSESGPPPGHPSLEHCPLPHDTYDAIAKLQSFHEQDLPAASQADYRSAIGHFIETIERIAVAGAHYECGAVLVWPYHVEPSLLADLKARRPHGLLVLAYYCVFLALLEKPYWFSRGWSRQLMGEIEASFAGQPMFLDMLKWPKRSVDALRVT
ncbi:hypothetical protein V2G26_005168 [Clonostachys chloroleuca]